MVKALVAGYFLPPVLDEHRNNAFFFIDLWHTQREHCSIHFSFVLKKLGLLPSGVCLPFCSVHQFPILRNHSLLLRESITHNLQLSGGNYNVTQCRQKNRGLQKHRYSLTSSLARPPISEYVPAVSHKSWILTLALVGMIAGASLIFVGLVAFLDEADWKFVVPLLVIGVVVYSLSFASLLSVTADYAGNASVSSSDTRGTSGNKNADSRLNMMSLKISGFFRLLKRKVNSFKYSGRYFLLTL
jgi:hypothetical protein